MTNRYRASRRYLLASLLGAALPRPLLSAPRPATLAGDFDLAAREVAARYAYMEPAAAQRFATARRAARPLAAKAKTPDELVPPLEHLVASLRDEHVTLSDRGVHPVRRVPAESDVWAAWSGGLARIEAVRVAGDADLAGLRPGDVVRGIQGVATDQAVARLLEGDRRPAARDWALRRLLAGPWVGTFTVDVRGSDGPRRVQIERHVPAPAHTPPMAGRRIGEQRDLGYIRIRNALDDPGLVADFDTALMNVREMRAVMLDLRDLNGRGNHEVTRAILGRFVERETPWQVRVARDGRRLTDTVAPRGPRHATPLLVLADRWTAGEGEALAGGLVAAAGARYVGTPMAGLRGELDEIRLPASGIVVRLPTQRTLLADGTPRERLVPTVAVDPAAPSGGPGDPILYQALKLLG